MEDSAIIELYWSRDQAAVAETAKKYGAYCRYIARQILQNDWDSEECVNDTYMNAWNSIPPKRPPALGASLGKITRNLALNLHMKNNAQKRGRGQCDLVLDELEECLSPRCADTDPAGDIALRDAMAGFIAALDETRRRIFLRRYWYLCPIKEIAQSFGMSESKVKSILMRTRIELKQLLEREGIYL